MADAHKFAPTDESLAAHEARYDEMLTPEMRARLARPARDGETRNPHVHRCMRCGDEFEGPDGDWTAALKPYPSAGRARSEESE